MVAKSAFSIASIAFAFLLTIHSCPAQDLRQLVGHTSNVWDVALSPDGRTALTGGADKTARLWNVVTGQERSRLNVGSGVVAVAFSPDSHTIVTGSTDGIIRLWDAETGSKLRQFVVASSDWKPGLGIVFAPDGHRFATVSNGQVKLWDLLDEKMLHAFVSSVWETKAIAFSPEGRTMLTGGRDGIARLWDTTTGRELKRFVSRLEYDAPFKDIVSVAFSPDGQYILTADADQCARLWSITNGNEIRRFCPKKAALVREHPVSVAFARDGQTVLVGTQEKGLWFFSTSNGSILRRFHEDEGLRSSPGSVRSMAISSDGRLLLTANDGATVQLWDLARDSHESDAPTNLTTLSNSPIASDISAAGQTAIPTPMAPPEVLTSQADEGSRRIALVIGNSNYTNQGLLPNPRRDADAVAASLRSVGFQTVTVKDDMTRAEMISALDSFSDQAANADWALIYFSGHGLELGGTNYVVPVDAKLLADRDVQDEAISLDRILSATMGARKLHIVILDACRDDPFIPKMRQTVATRSIGRGLARVEPEGATLVVYAARDGQIAYDGDGRNSPFVTALTKRITQPNLEINKLFRLVHDDVMAATGKRQEPYVYGALPGEDFYFLQK